MVEAFSLEGKLALVTGSTAGIGQGIAQKLAQLGARVGVQGRTQERIDSAMDSIAQDGGVDRDMLFPVPGDMGTREGVEQVIAAVEAQGELDILVNNVGIFSVASFEETTDEEWERYFSINVMSAVRLCRHFAPIFRARERPSRIINISSEAGARPLPHMLAYSVSKGAMNALSRGLAETMKGTPCNVCACLVGPTLTPGVDKYLEELGATKGKSKEEAAREYFEQDEPTSLIARFLSVEEVANTVGFLASDASSGITGCAQRIEGGIIRSIV